MIDLIRQATDRLMQSDILFQINDTNIRDKVTSEMMMLVEMCYSSPIYMVKCDEDNNPPEVANENKLVVTFTGTTKEIPSFSLILKSDMKTDAPIVEVRRI